MTEQWSAERANEWFASIPLPFGCNFLPSTAVNSTEMWQAETFDPATIERELRFAAGLGYNTVRVFLQFMVWEADPAGHHERLETFLRLADAAGITMMPILFDDCRFDGRDPQGNRLNIFRATWRWFRRITLSTNKIHVHRRRGEESDD